MKPKSGLFLLALIAVAATLGGCPEKKTATAPPPPPEVDVAAVVQKDVPIFREWVASLDGSVNATILAQVQGYLIKQNYREGEYVKKGTLLFEIDPRPFEAVLDETRAALSRQNAVLQTASATLDRIEPLAAANAVSQKDRDDAIGRVQAAEAEVLQARAAVRRAELELGFTKIVSPIDGIAGAASAQIGDLVGTPQSKVLTAVSTVDPVKVYVPISEREYLEIVERYKNKPKPGPGEAGKTPFNLILADGSVWPQIGTFSFADRQVDPQTGTLRVAILFPNPDFTLRPGQYARVRAALKTELGALLVPQRSVGELQGNYQVAVVNAENTVQVRNVKMGERVGDMWIVREGLAPGDRVVAEGIQKVSDGIKIAPRNTGTPGPATAKP